MTGRVHPVTEGRDGPFWDVMTGRVAPPPAAALLGWQLVEIDPDSGTIDLQVQCLAPAKPGELRARGRIVRRSRDVAFLAGELRDSTDRLLATATATASAIIRRRPG